MKRTKRMHIILEYLVPKHGESPSFLVLPPVYTFVLSIKLKDFNIILKNVLTTLKLCTVYRIR